VGDRDTFETPDCAQSVPDCCRPRRLCRAQPVPREHRRGEACVGARARIRSRVRQHLRGLQPAAAVGARLRCVQPSGAAQPGESAGQEQSRPGRCKASPGGSA